ncbi:putative nwd2 protein [Mycena sanguinolenta]|uniref:Putative nwd2 protein n=1 Tax=Mycena sanguinolenta TaxID=230812 RepID=A0A8H6Z5K6_9AGAR|nr:putative nwd2 protein [Mycena sanguinolenta]
MFVRTMNNHFVGGTGGAGGESHGNSMGGRGGEGMGASLNCDIRVRDGNFIMNNACDRGERGIDILHRSVALEAIHDSTDSFLEPKCHPETRTQMLKDLSDWAVETRPKTTILWLYGPAGAGKSAIMRTLATRLDEDRRLGACFFFKRGHPTRGNARTLFTTIAYQLALNVEWLRTPISQVVEQNPSIVARSMATQMQELISKPCRPRAQEHRDPIVILIDGLDECDGHSVQGEVLRAIPTQTSSNHPIFFRFIVASRPEPHIRQVFQSSAPHYRSFNVEQSFEDVRKYLRDEFSRIHCNHFTMQNISSPWPAYHVLEELVDKSSGYFIYASTIIKFIDDENYRPTELLEVVRNVNSPRSESAYDALDQLYMTILSSAPRQSELILILGAIVSFTRRPEEIDRLFRLAEGETRLLLRGLHSLLVVPSNDYDTISSHHASFFDFLNNYHRSGTFCVSTVQHRIDLARIILKAYVGPNGNADRFWSRFLDHNLIPFIIYLPPSAEVAELFPLIGTMEPEWIFGFSALNLNVASPMLAWLKKIASAPRDLITLWEDYEYMAFFEQTVLYGSPAHPTAKRMVVYNPELLRILVSLVVFRCDRLTKLRRRLDLTWTDMRISICGPSSNIEHGLPVLAVRLAFRDVALQCIRKMVENHINISGEVYSWESRDAPLESICRYQIPDHATGEEIFKSVVHRRTPRELVDGISHLEISYLVRLSPPCPVLYRELWSVPLVPMGSSSPYGGGRLIYHVSKWLESFPDPPMELIASWNQIASYLPRGSILGTSNYSDEGLNWRVGRWNDVIVHLALPEDLKLPYFD